MTAKKEVGVVVVPVGTAKVRTSTAPSDCRLGNFPDN